MMRAFNVGIGLFTLALLWTLGICVYLITRRIKSSISLIGPISIFLLALLTLFLSLLPRYKLNVEPESSEMDKMFEFFKFNILSADWLYIWRSGLITFNMIAILVVSIIIYSNYIAKKNVRLRAANKKKPTRKNSIENGHTNKPIPKRRSSRGQLITS